MWSSIRFNLDKSSLDNGTLIRMSRNRILKKVNYWSFFTLRAVDKKLKAIWTTGLVLLQHLNSYEVQCEPRLQYFIYKSTHIIYNTIIHTIYITILPHTHIVLYRYIVTKSSIRISWVTFGLASVSHIYTMRLSFVLSQSLWQWASESIVVGALA